MDTCNDESIETFGSPKTLNTVDENKDFISDLPDPIVVRILSFLPLTDAISTLLVRRFGNLWRRIPVLDINYRNYHKRDVFNCKTDEHNNTFTNVIRHVLNLHDSGTLDKLRLHIYFAQRESVTDGPLVEDHLEKDTAEQIEKLIRHAMSRNVKILDLNLACCSYVGPWERYDLPDVFTSRYLTDLRLTGCDLRSCTVIDLKLLKVLFLRQVSLRDHTMENFLIGCPFLEDLSVVDCNTLNNLNCKNPNLKKLRVNTNDWRLFLSCPYVLSLEIDGYLESLFLLDVSSVVDASIVLHDFEVSYVLPYTNTKSFFQKVCKSKILNLCASSIRVLTIWSLTNVPCPSLFCKSLILKLDLNKWHFPGLALLLRSASSIETLTINVGNVYELFFMNDEENWILSHDFDGDSYWDSQEDTLPHLETILVYGYRKEPFMIELVKFLLRSAPTLQKMVITTNKTVNDNGESEFTTDELLELSQKLLSSPRASSQAIIRVL